MKPASSDEDLKGRAGELPHKWLYSKKDFAKKNLRYILWRLVFISFFFLITVILQEKRGFSLFPFSYSRLYFWIALQYGLSILYLFWLLSGKALQWLGIIQLVVDGLFVTTVVLFTGGLESFFPYLYFLVIVAGGVLFHRPGGVLTALYAVLLYGLLLLMQGTERVPFNLVAVIPMNPHPGNYYLYQMIMHGVGFILIGYLSSSYARQTVQQRSQIEIQKRNIDQLEGMNRIIIENLDFGLITLDHDNTIQTLNPTGEKILGYRLAQLKNKPLAALFPELERYLKQGEGERTDRMELSYQRPQGQAMPIGCSFNRVREDQALGIGKILSFKDISKIKAMESHLRQIDRLALMGKMAAGIAHEIRNPLASISGSIQVLQDDFKGERTGERLLKIITREVTRLETLVKSFLAFSKPVPQVEALTDISELLQGTVELVKKNREVPPDLDWDVDIEPHLIVNISSGEMSQITWNLLTNAVQALDSGGKISIKAGNIPTGNSEKGVQLVFKDNGPGISEKDLSRIFDPFYTTKENGIGLGLNMVQKIIADRGGTIEVISAPGQGSEFVILFPPAGVSSFSSENDRDES